MAPPDQIKGQAADKHSVYRQLILLLSGRDLPVSEEGRADTGLSSVTNCYQLFLACSCFLTGRMRESTSVPTPNALRFMDQRDPPHLASSSCAVSAGPAGSK